MKFTKKIVSFLMVIALLVTAFPWSTMVTDVNAVTLAQLQEKYPSGAYWNHYVNNIYEAGDTINNNGNEYFAEYVSWTPCVSHSVTSVDYYVGNYDCNYFDGGMQCCGFARRLGYEVYGSRPSSWSNSYTMSVKAGDIVHYTGYDADPTYGHWVFVTAVSGTTITVAECNYNGNCRINWGRTFDLNYVSSCQVFSAPYALGTTQEAPRMWCESLNKPVEIQKGSGFTFTGNICSNNGVKWYALVIYEYLPETDEWNAIQILEEGVWQVGAFYTYSMNTLAKGLNFSSLNPGSYALSVQAMDFDGTYYTVEDMRFTVTCKHNYNSWKVITDPTCTEPGVCEYTCSVCGSKYSEAISALGHQLSVPKLETIGGIDYNVVRCIVCNTIWKKTPVSDNTHYDPDGDGEYFVLKASDAIITKDATTVDVDIDILYNSGVYGMKYYVIYDKELTLVSNKNVTKGDAFNDFTTSDIGAFDTPGDSISFWDWTWMVEKKFGDEYIGYDEYFDYEHFLNNQDDLLITSVYSECIDVEDFSTDTGTICTLTFQIDPNNTKDHFVVQILPVYGNFIRAEGYDFVEIYDPIGLPGTITIESNECNHNHKAVVTEPTCTTRGYTTYTCSACGDCYVTDYVEALGHTEVVDDAVEPTCTKTGLTEGKHCEVCGVVHVAQKVVSSKGHSYKAEITAPDCTEDGYTTYTCSVCNDSYISNEVSALGHSYNSEVTEPTCTEDGYEEFTCKNCGDTYREVIDALGHTEVVDEAVEPTCTKTGLTEGSHCEVCGEVFVAQETVPVLGHNYKAVVTAPSCEEGGYTTYTCSVCSDSYVSDYVDAFGHSYNSETTEPTCTEDGYEEFTCENCGDTYSETIEALGHTEVVDEAVEPTCTETGLTEGSHCAVCCEVFAVQEEVPALGHNYKSVVTAPTTTSQGFTTHTCVNCSDSYVDSYVPPVVDENAPKIVISEARARAGETVTVDVSLENNPGINAFMLSIDYADCLILDKVEVNSELGGSFVYSKKAVWGSNADSDFNGRVLTLTFTVAEDAEPCEAYISINYNPGDICNYDEEDVNFVVIAGKVSVVDYIAGDINGDGIVNSKDLTRLMKHLSGEDVAFVEAAVDVNGDGRVNMKDWTRLMKYLAGEEVEIY